MTCSTSSHRYKTPLCLGHDSDALTDSFFLISRGYIIITTVEITSCASCNRCCSLYNRETFDNSGFERQHERDRHSDQSCDWGTLAGIRSGGHWGRARHVFSGRGPRLPAVGWALPGLSDDLIATQRASRRPAFHSPQDCWRPEFVGERSYNHIRRRAQLLGEHHGIRTWAGGPRDAVLRRRLSFSGVAGGTRGADACIIGWSEHSVFAYKSYSIMSRNHIY